MSRRFCGTLSHPPAPKAIARIAEHPRAVCRSVWLGRARYFLIIVREQRGGRVRDCNGSAVLRPKAGGDKLKERMWGRIIPILATECTEDTEKCKNALCTQRSLRFQISHKLYISTAMVTTGSNLQQPRLPHVQFSQLMLSARPERKQAGIISISLLTTDYHR
jgi:hypothetical protein